MAITGAETQLEQQLEPLVTRHVGRRQVQQHHVGTNRGGGNGVGAARRTSVTCSDEELLEQLDDLALVVDDQHSGRFTRSHGTNA
jgi:hypothetical protein